MDGFKQLAAGIVEQAVLDYLHMRKRLYEAQSRNKFNKDFAFAEAAICYYKKEIKKLEHFFYSEWFHTLVPELEPDTVLAHLEKRFEEIKDKSDQALKNLGFVE